MIEFYFIVAVVTSILCLVLTHSNEWREMFDTQGRFSQTELILASLWLGLVWPYFWFTYFRDRSKL